MSTFNKNEYQNDTTVSVKGRNVRNENEEYVQEYATRGYCSQCYRERGNTVGIISTRAMAWFCSGFCSHAYFHDHDLTKYHMIIQNNITKNRDNFETIKRRKFKLGLSTH